MEDFPLNIEDMIVAVGSFLFNTENSITDVDSDFLRDLRLVIDSELERREVTVH